MNEQLPDFNALWDYGDPAASEAQFQAVLAQTQERADADYLAQLCSQIARTFGLRRMFDQALAWIERGEALCADAEARGEAAALARVRLLLERGRTLNSSGEAAGAVPVFTQALELAQAGGFENYAVDSAHMLGIAAPGEASLEWNFKAIEMAEQAADPLARKWLGPLYNNTGWSLHELGRFDEALELFDKSLEWRMEKGHVRETQIAKWCVGRCLRSLGRVDEALALQRKLEGEIAASGLPSDGFVYEELGECLLALGQAEAARPNFAEALAMLSQDIWFTANEPERLARLQELGGAAASR